MSVSGTNIRSPLTFDNYTVNYVTFKANPRFEADSVALNFEITSKVDSNEQNADVTLCLTLFADAEENNYPFEMELNVTGHFRVTEDVVAGEGDLFRLNAISILFPYVRALVTTFTSNCNVSPLILPPINVHKVLAQSS